MHRTTLLAMTLCFLLLPAGITRAASTTEPEGAVSSQGILQSTSLQSLVVSPSGVYTMEVVPRAGDAHHFKVDLMVRSLQGRVDRLSGIQANAFFLTDDGRILALDRSEALGARTPLTILDRDGTVLLETGIDLISDARLSPDGSRFAYRTPAGIQVLDLTGFGFTDYPRLAPFAVGPNGRVAGIDWENRHELRLFDDPSRSTTIQLAFTPRRLAFTPDGSDLLALGRTELIRIALPSGDSERLLRSPEDAELRDLRVTPDLILVGLRSIEGNTYRGERVTLSPDGEVLSRTEGPSMRIPRAEPRSKTRTGIPWPLEPNGQHSIGNTYGEYQNYGSAYLHPGVDIFGSSNQPLYAVAGGVVKAILTTSGQWHWRIAIGEPGNGTTQGYLYAHVDPATIAVDVGDPIVQGQYLGGLVTWPIYDFTHVHFARIEDTGTQWYGSWLNTDNPHLDLENQSETTAPIFEPARNNDLLAFCNNETSSYQNPNALHGLVDIIAHVGDTIESSWVCAVQEIRYTIYPLGNPDYRIVDNKLAVFFDMVLDTYQGGPIDPFLVGLLYKKDGTCNTQGDYDYREFYHILTNSDGDQDYEESDLWEAWDTTLLPDGDYVVEVTAKDVAGNATTESMVVTTANGNPATIDPNDLGSTLLRQSYPNPTGNTVSVSFTLQTASRIDLSIYDVHGRLVRTLFSGDLPEGTHTLEWDGRDAGGIEVGAGVYPYRLMTPAGVRSGKLTRLR